MNVSPLTVYYHIAWNVEKCNIECPDIISKKLIEYEGAEEENYSEIFGETSCEFFSNEVRNFFFLKEKQIF